MASDFVGPQPLKTNHPMPFNGNDSTALLRKIPRMIEVDLMKFKASHFNGVTFEISSESQKANCTVYTAQIHFAEETAARNAVTDRKVFNNPRTILAPLTSKPDSKQ